MTKGISYVRLGRHKSNLNVSTSRTADNKPCKTQPLHRDGRTRESEAVQPTVRGPAKRRLELDKAMMNPFTKKLKEQDAQLKCEKMREAETLPTTNTTRRRTSHTSGVPHPRPWPSHVDTTQNQPERQPSQSQSRKTEETAKRTPPPATTRRPNQGPGGQHAQDRGREHTQTPTKRKPQGGRQQSGTPQKMGEHIIPAKEHKKKNEKQPPTTHTKSKQPTHGENPQRKRANTRPEPPQANDHRQTERTHEPKTRRRTHAKRKTRSEHTHRKSECRPHRRTPIHKVKIAKNPETSIKPRTNLRDS